MRKELMNSIIGSGWEPLLCENFNLNTSTNIFADNSNITECSFKFILEKTLFLKLVGHGAYGEVWLAQDLQTNSLIAVKKYYTLKERDGIAKTCIRELNLLNELKGHPNIIYLLGVQYSFGNTDVLFNASDSLLKEQLNKYIQKPDDKEVKVDEDGEYFLENVILNDKDDQIQASNIIYAAFEYMPYDLNAYIRKVAEGELSLNLSQIRFIALSVLNALHYIHLNDILHRDIKSANLLIDIEGNIKLADFGLARRVTQQQCCLCADDILAIPIDPFIDINPVMTNVVMTLWYRAPEVLLGAQQYTAACDIWSFGCLVYELLAKKPLFVNAQNEEDMISAMLEYFGTPTEETWPGVSKLPLYKPYCTYVRSTDNLLKNKLSQTVDPCLTDFICSCLNLDPAQRLTANELLEHDYITNKDVQKLNVSTDLIYNNIFSSTKKYKDKLYPTKQYTPTIDKRNIHIEDHVKLIRSKLIQKIRNQKEHYETTIKNYQTSLKQLDSKLCESRLEI